MTIGSVHSLDPKKSLNAKVWKGHDGKYETGPYGRRMRYNKYDSTILRESYKTSVDGSSVFSIDRWTPEHELSANEINGMYSKLVSRLHGHNFRLGVTAGEAPKTLNAIVETVDTLAKAIVHCKRGNFSQAAKVLGVSHRTGTKTKFKETSVSGRFLELQYGWKPLLQDAYNAAEFLASKQVPQPLVVRATYRRQNRAPVDALSSGIKLWISETAARIKLEVDEQDSMAERNTLSLLNPALVAWELVPYSFVIDWFLPIGEWLDNLAMIPFLRGRFLLSRRTTMRVRWSWFSPPHPWVDGMETTGLKVLTSREVLSSLKVPLPNFVPPSEAVSGVRIYNAVALAHQKIRQGR